jgi:hypothetical protein
MADDLRPELFDEPLARSEEERNQSYGKEWLDKLWKEMDEQAGIEDKPTETTEDKFLPTRDRRRKK